MPVARGWRTPVLLSRFNSILTEPGWKEIGRIFLHAIDVRLTLGANAQRARLRAPRLEQVAEYDPASVRTLNSQNHFPLNNWVIGKTVPFSGLRKSVREDLNLSLVLNVLNDLRLLYGSAGGTTVRCPQIKLFDHSDPSGMPLFQLVNEGIRY